MRIVLAFRAFFAVLVSPEAARWIQQIVDRRSSSRGSRKQEKQKSPAASSPASSPASSEKPTEPSAAKKTSVAPARNRSDAITLLSVLQREARLLDLVHESLDSYSDEQIGSAARQVLADTRHVLDRGFGIRAAAEPSEGDRIEIPENAPPTRWRVVGNATGRAGVVAHGGWVATRVDLPEWTGPASDAMVIAPIEVDTASAG